MKVITIKKIIAFMAAAAISVSVFSGCGEKTSGNEEAVSEASTISYTGEMRGISAKELVSELKVGWNLGNTLEANGGSGLDSETSWGNPKTTKEIIDTVQAAGFNTIRLPVTWSNHFTDDKYTIDEQWLARVKEVAEYALADDMYVIINMHHENDWLIPDSEHIDSVETQFKAMWTQIAAYFADYGDHVIFEGMNEPRVVGGANEWNGGNADIRSCINKLNQDFIDTVRASSGNNAKRLLLITTEAASISDNSFDGYVFPTDGNIALSLHAYTPYRFTFDSKGQSWNTAVFDDSVAKDITTMLDTINAYTSDKDIPVVITECGAVSKILDTGASNAPDVAKWAASFLSQTKERGIPCIFWDNNCHYGSGELFGMLKRLDLTWHNPDMMTEIKKIADES